MFFALRFSKKKKTVFAFNHCRQHSGIRSDERRCCHVESRQDNKDQTGSVVLQMLIDQNVLNLRSQAGLERLRAGLVMD